jgi:hypothetical protein
MTVTTNSDYGIFGSHSQQKLIWHEEEGTTFFSTSESAGPTTQIYVVGDIKLQKAVIFLSNIKCLVIIVDQLVFTVKNVLNL